MIEEIKALAEIEDMGDRMQKACLLTSGNIVEIGGGEGTNTIRFLRTAQHKNCKVIVVDPFQYIEGADESYFTPYTAEKFMANVGNSERLHIIHLPSQHKWVPEELATFKPIGFMFIDGLQDRLSVLRDLYLAEGLGVEIICVDDFDRLNASSQVPLAVENFIASRTPYKFINIGKKEAYFVK